MTFNDRRALDLLPARIAALEARIAELNAVLSDPDLYQRNPLRFREATEALAAKLFEVQAYTKSELNRSRSDEPARSATPCRSRAAGFDRHLVKPVDSASLRNLIADVSQRIGQTARG